MVFGLQGIVNRQQHNPERVQSAAVSLGQLLKTGKGCQADSRCPALAACSAASAAIAVTASVAFRA